MILFDAPLPVLILGAGIAVIVFFFLIFAAIAFIAYKLLKRKK